MKNIWSKIILFISGAIIGVFIYDRIISTMILSQLESDTAIDTKVNVVLLENLYNNNIQSTIELLEIQINSGLEIINNLDINENDLTYLYISDLYKELERISVEYPERNKLISLNKKLIRN